MERCRDFPPATLRWSELKHMGKSPAHFRAAYTDPVEQSPAMRFGWLVHSLALGHGEYAVYEGETRRGKEWDAFSAKNAGKTIVKRSEVDEAQRVVDAVRADPVAAPLLTGLYEQELAWEWLGRKCAGRIDILGQDAIIDLKTTNFAEPAYFAKVALRMALHAQVAWYLDGARACGFSPTRASIIAVETAPPFAVTVLHLTPRALEEGRKLLRSWIEKVVNCEASGEWPGYVQTAVPLDVAEADDALLIDGEVIAA